MDDHKGFAQWIKNGGKYTVAMVTVIFLAVVGLYLQLYNYTNEDEPPPAIEIQSVSVSASSNREIVWTKEVCNKLDGALSVQVSISLESEPPIKTVPIPGAGFPELIPPGCTARPTRVVALPDQVTEGKWRLNVSIFTASSAAGGLTLVSGQSELFEVTSDEGDE